MSETPLRTLIVDDEPLGVERLQILYASIPEVRLVESAADAAAALRLIDATAPELLLLDIAMPGLSGIELAAQLIGLKGRPQVVFCLAYDAFAVAAFDVEAVDYLLKPIDPARLQRAVVRAMAKGDGEARCACGRRGWRVGDRIPGASSRRYNYACHRSLACKIFIDRFECRVNSGLHILYVETLPIIVCISVRQRRA